MKIQLDTTQKTIKVEERVKLSKFMEIIKKLLPNNEWKEFTLETNTTIHYWSDPIIIKEYPVYPKPYYPTYPWYCSSSTTAEYKVTAEKDRSDYSLNSGVYNIEAK